MHHGSRPSSAAIGRQELHASVTKNLQSRLSGVTKIAWTLRIYSILFIRTSNVHETSENLHSLVQSAVSLTRQHFLFLSEREWTIRKISRWKKLLTPYRMLPIKIHDLRWRHQGPSPPFWQQTKVSIVLIGSVNGVQCSVNYLIGCEERRRLRENPRCFVWAFTSFCMVISITQQMVISLSQFWCKRFGQ
jgi:hypothetical protein